MSNNKSSLLISDIIDELFNENKRLFKQLLFADKCLKMFCEFKTFIELNSHKFVNNFDSFDKQKYNMFIEKISELEKDMELDVRQEMSEVEEVDQSDHRLDNEINVSEELSMNEMCEQSEDELKSRPFVCGINGCNKRYSKKDSLLTHQKLNHKNPIIVCTQPGCDYKTRNQYIMKRHKSVHSSHKPFRNNVPKERSNNEMFELSEEELKSRPLVCGINGCKNRYSKLNSLYSHQKHNHNNPMLVCSHSGCHYETRNKYLMKEHKSIHSSDRPFACDWPECQFTSKWSSVIRKHKKLVHRKDMPLSCQWPGCDYTGTSGERLKRHYQCHGKFCKINDTLSSTITSCTEWKRM